MATNQKKKRSKKYNPTASIDRAVKYTLCRLWICDSTVQEQSEVQGMEHCTAAGVGNAAIVEHRVLHHDGQRPLLWRFWIGFVKDGPDGEPEVMTIADNIAELRVASRIGDIVTAKLEAAQQQLDPDNQCYGYAWVAVCGDQDLAASEPDFIKHFNSRGWNCAMTNRLNFRERVIKVDPTWIDTFPTGQPIGTQEMIRCLRGEDVVESKDPEQIVGDEKERTPVCSM